MVYKLEILSAEPAAICSCPNHSITRKFYLLNRESLMQTCHVNRNFMTFTSSLTTTSWLFVQTVSIIFMNPFTSRTKLLSSLVVVCSFFTKDIVSPFIPFAETLCKCVVWGGNFMLFFCISYLM